MIHVLAAIGGGSTLILTIAFITLTFLNRKDNRELLAARDVIEKAHEELNKVRGELLVETTAHAVTNDELAKEKALRTDLEAQLNQAWREAREEAVRIIATSGIADAVHLGNRILSAPMPGVRLSDTPDGALEKP